MQDAGFTLLDLFSKKFSNKFSNKKADKKSAQAFELKLDLPVYRQQESKLPDAASVWLRLDHLRGEAVHLLVELNHFLHELNRTFVDIGRRYTITERCLEYAAPVIRSIYLQHQKSKALPESQPRREEVIAAIKCAKELSCSYKRIVKSNYGLSGKQFKSAKKRLTQSAFSALETIHAEQRLRALRYQKLAESDWRDCNNLYSVISQIDDPQQKCKATLYLSTIRSSPQDSGVKSLRISSEELYVLIQLFGFVDHNSMSLQQIVFTENYLKQALPDLKVVEYDPDQLPYQYVMSSFGQERPPVLNDGFDDTKFTLSIDLKPLVSRLREDYRRLLPQLSGVDVDVDNEGDGAKSRNAKVVNNLEDIERLLALQNMLKKMREAQRADTRKYSAQEQHLYIYNGFTSGFRMLSSNRQGISGHGQTQNQLNLSLAQRSALLADGGSDDNHTFWEIINESAGGILLRTKETQFIKNLYVGQLVVFAKSKDSLSTPACGWVVRICRDYQRNVEISLKILAMQIECVVVQTEFLRKNAMGMPGIMILDAGEELQLLMHFSHRLLPATRVFIRRDGNCYAYTVGDMAFFQREFVVYRLQ